MVYFVREKGYAIEIQNVTVEVVSTPPGNTPAYLQTVNGSLPTGPLMNTIGTSPIVKLKFTFDNTTPDNRELFTKGYLKDILLMVPCKADLKAYPL